MEIADMVSRFRGYVRDNVAPYLWSDAEIISYIDEAQREFCRRTGGLADATSTECARVEVVAGQALCDISPKVLKIRAVFDEDGKQLVIVNFEDIQNGDLSGEELFADVEGTVSKVVVGMEPNKIQLIHTPAEDQTLNLIVYRLPIEDIEDTSCELEIDAQHHEALLLWARRLAHLKADAEAYDRGRADQFEREFLAYCSLASDEKGRREHKYRAVQFSYW
jgi:hypothetical protein